MGSKMSSKRQSSSSQSRPRYGDGKWDSSNSSAVDGFGKSLSTVSLVSLPTEVSEPYPYELHADCPSYLGDSAGYGGSPSYLPGVPEYSDQYPYTQVSEPWVSSLDLYQIQAAPPNESLMDSGLGYTGSTLVSPSSTPPSRRSTMDEMPRLEQHQVRANKTPERRSSGDVPKRDKKGGSRYHRYHWFRAPRSDKGINDSTAEGKSLYPYPPVLDEADLYDHPPASSSNGSWTRRDGHEDPSWDMCE